MPTRERIRVDLLAAIDNKDGTVSARAYPLVIFPLYAAQYNAFRIDRVELNPSTAVVELQFMKDNGRIDIFSTFGGGLTNLGELIEHSGMTLTMLNLSVDSGVSVTVWLIMFKYNEPRG